MNNAKIPVYYDSEYFYSKVFRHIRSDTPKLLVNDNDIPENAKIWYGKSPDEYRTPVRASDPEELQQELFTDDEMRNRLAEIFEDGDFLGELLYDPNEGV